MCGKSAKLLRGACVVAAVMLAACGGGGESSPAPITTHAVTLSWQPNRDSGVNRAGGGYQVSITGQPMIVVPYVSGPAAPTSATVMLTTGTYTVAVRAFAALDSQGGNTGSLSVSSVPIIVNVP